MCICAEGNGTHSSILVWEIPWTEEPGGLQSKSMAFLKRGNSPRKVQALTKGPKAFDGTARTVAFGISSLFNKLTSLSLGISRKLDIIKNYTQKRRAVT